MTRERLISICIKLGVFSTIFFISLLIANKVLNRNSLDLTSDMRKATLPVIYMNVNDEFINPLHGYRDEMQSNYMRDVLTPLQANRDISFRIDPYSAIITKIGYEVRTIDAKRLIEDNVVPEFENFNNSIAVTISLKDLIDDDKEYMLIIKLTNGVGEEIRYYTRIINQAELALNDKFNFVKSFSAKTFDKNLAQELTQYMESNSEGNNTSFGYVNIHSNFNQLTWGNLEPTVCSNKDLELYEIDTDNATIKLSYQVFMKNELHNVSEYFRIRKGSDRMYLMDYERTCNQLFDETKNVLVKGKILHGIVHDLPEYIENENGSILCFVQQNSLFSFNTSTNNLAKVYSFWDTENNDIRTRLNEHGIKVFSIDDSGNLLFSVYGYMNRGPHEGQVGIDVYYYNSTLNTIEEIVYIPYHKSFNILQKEMDCLCYVNTRNMFFFFLDGNVYNIRLDSRKAELIDSGLSEDRFVYSQDNSIIAWQVASDVYDYSTINLYSLDEIEPKQIQASSGDIIIPLGFMEHDFIFGTAKISDITTDSTGSTLIPMYSVKIQDKDGNIKKNYHVENVYILSIEIKDNMIILHRIYNNPDTGLYENVEDDQIMDNQKTSTKKNKLTSVVTEELETSYQTILAKTPSSDTVKNLTPKEVIYEENRDISLEDITSSDISDNLYRYFVYVKGDIEGIYSDASKAVKQAESHYGVVVNEDCQYIWQSGNRRTKKQISSIEPRGIEEGQSSVAVCIDEMLKLQGIYKDTEKLLSTNSVLGILQDSLGSNVLDMTGCSLNSMLYYVSQDYPVLVLTNEGEAVLIVGYDAKNTILFNPIEGTIAKMGMMDSTNWFYENKNRFITYIN